ncbi:MAG: Gfo/Idh/MocA family oxidoreductase [Silicimonas sp.]|nr:Gfo/Idh/MocA family oxidoreductase [Silicimonas sp.]
MSVRVAVIGAGIMGSDHARVIAEDIPGATLQVICDVSEGAARKVADACGAADVASDGQAVIARDDIDAVLIASPDGTHAELTLAALALGKPVLCEKPLAVTTGECLRVLKAESEHGAQLVQVGFMRRFDPSYVKMRDTLRAGTLGPAVMMHNFHRNVKAPRGFTGQMAITNSAPHEFDAIRFVLDADVTAISAFEPATEGLAGKPVVMVMETSAGQLVTVEVNNNAAYGYDVRGELVGTKGSVSLGRSVSATLDAALASSTEYAKDWRPRFADAYRLQNKAWIHTILTGTLAADASNAWDGYCATAIAEAGVQALATGQKTPVELVKRPELYVGLEATA